MRIRSVPAILVINVLLAIAISTAALAQESATPYAGQQERAIKSLSEREVQGYLAGGGMGFAKPAELNHYPGPKHVLELASEMGLSAEEIAATQVIFDEMNVDAMRLGKQLVEGEAELDRLFASGDADEANVLDQVKAVGSVRAKLRFCHLRAHLRMKAIMSEEQVKKYDLQRGYGGEADAEHVGGHEHEMHGG